MNQLDLYQQIIIEHNKKPKNYGVLNEASHSAEGFNPLCGDRLTIYVKLNSENLIEELSFCGDGCAISKASASMMTAEVKGKSLEEAKKLFAGFQKLLLGKIDDEESKELGKLKIFSGICRYPARVKCANLAWHTLQGALDENKNVKTE